LSGGVETNLFGVHELTQAVIPVMRQQGHGRIINCSSVLGLVGMKWRGAYVSTKFALEGLTDVLRIEMARTPYYVTTPTYLMGTLRRILPTRALDWVIHKAG